MFAVELFSNFKVVAPLSFVFKILNLSASDYVEVFVTQDSTNDVEVGDASHFHGFRLIGA